MPDKLLAIHDKAIITLTQLTISRTKKGKKRATIKHHNNHRECLFRLSFVFVLRLILDSSGGDAGVFSTTELKGRKLPLKHSEMTKSRLMFCFHLLPAKDFTRRLMYKEVGRLWYYIVWLFCLFVRFAIFGCFIAINHCCNKMKNKNCHFFFNKFKSYLFVLIWCVMWWCIKFTVLISRTTDNIISYLESTRVQQLSFELQAKMLSNLLPVK